MENQLIPTQVAQLVVANRVDLDSCPHLAGSAAAANAYGVVPAVWAYVRDGLQTDQQRNDLGTALISL